MREGEGKRASESYPSRSCTFDVSDFAVAWAQLVLASRLVS